LHETSDENLKRELRDIMTALEAKETE